MANEEIWKNWFKQAESDFEKAKVLLDSGNFDGVIFYSQQAIEKGLKALILRSGKGLVKIHNLMKLGDEVGLPDVFYGRIKDLNEGYIDSRYDMLTDIIPADRYSLGEVDVFIKLVEEVLQWIKQKI